MTKIYYILTTWFLCIFYDGVGQGKIIQGTVIDIDTREPMAFAAVGVTGTLNGTATNTEGRFVIVINDALTDSSLYCSFMGYKDFVKRIAEIDREIVIELEQDIFTLDEIEVRPWTPWEYIWNAMQKIPDNYPQTAYMTNGYYSELISENNVFLKFTEGVIETYNPAYGKNEASQSKALQARRREDLGTLQFMRKKIDKKYEREKRKAAKREEKWDQGETIDEEIISSTFGGPEEVLSSDPLRDTATFLNINFKKKYKYHIDGYTSFHGNKVIIVGFKSKGKLEHQRQYGKIYISLESDAIISIEYNSKIIIPAIAKPILFLIGIGISNPEIHATIHYRPIAGHWYLNDFSVKGGAKLTKKKMFKENEHSQFDIEMALINREFELDNVYKIPEEERIDRNKPLEEQVESDPEFWKNFKVVRPSKLSQ